MAPRPAVSSHLPTEVDIFVGRRRELTEARRLLEAYRLVTVVGPGGVGKTRIALRVAAAVRRSFPDGVHLVDLAGLSNGLLIGDTVVQALGLLDQSSRPAVDVLAEHLAQRRLLLVVDNCEHLIDESSDLVNELLRAAPEIRVLATSREPLRITGETVLEVEPCSAEDALFLFEERARAVQPGFAVTPDNRDAVAELCRRLDRLPLAIELAVVRLRVLSVAQILERLDDQFRLLTTPRRAAGRHGSLQATLDWSAQTCSKPERIVWARASVFAGGFDLDGAEWVCAGEKVSRGEVLDLLSGLVDKSILTARPGDAAVRYVWLDSLRAYGLRLLAERGEEAEVRRRHRDWCRALAGGLTEAADDAPAPSVKLRRLHLERANIRAALDFCLTEPDEARAALEMASSLVTYWLGSATLGEGRQWLERGLAADGAPSRERAQALWACGWIAVEQGDQAAAERLLAQAREVAGRLGDERASAWAIALSGYAALFAGDLTRARRLLEEGLARHRRAGNVYGALATMSGLAQTTSYLGDPVSETISGQALSLMAEHRFALTAAQRCLGLELARQGRLAEATEILREALRSAERFGQQYGVANCLEFLAWAAQSGGRPAQAARLLGASRAAYRWIGASTPRPQRDCGERYAEKARRALGEERFAAEYAHGAAMSPAEAVDYALARDRPAQPRPAAAEPSPLTRRERQVAGLVARGLSARQIAGELVISVRTAESHVANILTKLGFTSRAQIAAWAGRQEPRD